MHNLNLITKAFTESHYDGIVIGGQTASGKSALAVELAQEINGEVIGADSRQIYQGMVIGTGAIQEKEMNRIPHHLIGIIPPKKSLNASIYKELAYQKINEIIQRKHVPIIVGGTGLYLDSIIFNFSFKGVEEKPEMSPWKLLLVVINGDKNILNEKIDQRHRAMFTKTPSIIDETKELLKNGFTKELEAMTSIGYRESMQYIDGQISIEEAIKKTQQEARSYAKRQRTWLRRLLKKYPGIIIEAE